MANNLNTQQEYSESRRIIRQAQRDDQLVLFVGAGVSINSGMSSWENLTQKYEFLIGFSTKLYWTSNV